MVDVTVRGAGIFGLSVAWACMKRGASVRVIDPNGVAAGSSGGIVGALAPHTPDQWNAKKELQFQSLMTAEAWWGEVAELSGMSTGYGRVGRLQPIQTPAALDLARTRAEAAATTWKGMARWDIVESEAFGAWAPPSPTGWLIHDTLSARIHPRRACAALAEAICQRGGEVVADAVHEGKLVWATGVDGLRQLGKELGREIGNGVKGQAALMRHDAGTMPQIYADGLHIIGHADGTVAVGSTSERDYEDPVRVDEQLEDVIARARLVVPALAGADVIERWAGVRPRARSRAPMVGPIPGKPGEFVANGGFKIAFGVAAEVGEMMADLSIDGRDRIPDEFKMEASL